ncbi:hypothetical protein BYT27DRAFT_7218062 [Phlegmacium glaucopus]|nr:hypothetical protein BYT27DRAFT_7218062 [Phlegmacium glaucopus]
MTNGDKELLQELKQALMDDEERSKMPNGETNGWDFEWMWEGVSTSCDLDLGWEEKLVSQALDMYTRPKVRIVCWQWEVKGLVIQTFWFSSLTTNIVMLRTKDGRNPLQVRFW